MSTVKAPHRPVPVVEQDSRCQTDDPPRAAVAHLHLAGPEAMAVQRRAVERGCSLGGALAQLLYELTSD